MSLCWVCKSVRETVHTDELGRGYCETCAEPIFAPMASHLAYLMLTVPFSIGSVVSCKTGGQIYDGIGHVIEVSFDPKDLASPVVPMFKVQIDQKAYPEVPDIVWYSEVCLESVDTVEVEAV